MTVEQRAADAGLPGFYTASSQEEMSHQKSCSVVM